MRFNFKGLANVGAVWVASLMAALLAFLTQAALARSLQPSEYGILASCLSFYAVLGAFGHFGMGGVLIRQSAENPAQTQAWIDVIFKFSLCLVLLITIATLLVAYIKADYLTVICLLALLPVAYSYTFTELAIAKLQIVEKYMVLARTQITPNFLRFTFVLILIAFTADPIIFSLALGLGSLLAAFFAAYYFRQKIPDAKGGQPILKTRLCALSWPYAMSVTMYLAYTQGGVVLLKALSGAEDAGNYSIAIAILMAIYLLPIAVFQRVHAKKINILSSHHLDQLKVYLRKALMLVGVLGVLITVASLLLGEYIINFIFSDKYTKASAFFSIVAFSIPFRFLATGAGAALNSFNDTKVRVLIQSIALISFCILGIYLLPKYGAEAMSYLLVGAEVFIATSYILFLMSSIHKRLIKNNKIS